MEYAYHRQPLYSALPDSERERWLIADVEAVSQEVKSQGSYQRITILGKSLGTLAMGHLLTQEAASRIAKAHLAHNPICTSEIQACKNQRVIVIKGADHGLEIANNVGESIEVVGQIIQAIQTFMAC